MECTWCIYIYIINNKISIKQLTVIISLMSWINNNKVIYL